jgi:hypothetical protein
MVNINFIKACKEGNLKQAQSIYSKNNREVLKMLNKPVNNAYINPAMIAFVCA